MSYSFQGETGKHEPIATTLRAMFQTPAPTGWDEAKTDGVVPFFLSGEDDTSTVLDVEGANAVTFDKGYTRRIENKAALDNSQGDMENQIIITIFAANQKLSEMFELEVYRVLRYNTPLYGAKIKKSNGTDDSKILGFGYPLPRFDQFSAGSNVPTKSSKSQMLLSVYSQYNWT